MLCRTLIDQRRTCAQNEPSVATFNCTIGEGSALRAPKLELRIFWLPIPGVL